MMDHKGQMNEPSTRSDDIGRGWMRKAPLSDAIGEALRPPILDDRDVWTDEPVVRTDAEAARYWAAKHGETLQTIQDLRSDVSGARFERDIWWPLAFCVGVLCGAGLSWWLV